MTRDDVLKAVCQPVPLFVGYTPDEAVYADRFMNASCYAEQAEIMKEAESGVHIGREEWSRGWYARWAELGDTMHYHFSAEQLYVLAREAETLLYSTFEERGLRAGDRADEGPVKNAFADAVSRVESLHLKLREDEVIQAHRQRAKEAADALIERLDEIRAPDRIIWNGTVAQLAYLLYQLQDLGMIGNPHIWAVGERLFEKADGGGYTRSSLSSTADRAGFSMGDKPGRGGKDAEAIDELLDKLLTAFGASHLEKS
jgi:hypothetical protein